MLKNSAPQNYAQMVFLGSCLDYILTKDTFVWIFLTSMAWGRSLLWTKFTLTVQFKLPVGRQIASHVQLWRSIWVHFLWRRICGFLNFAFWSIRCFYFSHRRNSSEPTSKKTCQKKKKAAQMEDPIKRAVII